MVLPSGLALLASVRSKASACGRLHGFVGSVSNRRPPLPAVRGCSAQPAVDQSHCDSSHGGWVNRPINDRFTGVASAYPVSRTQHATPTDDWNQGVHQDSYEHNVASWNAVIRRQHPSPLQPPPVPEPCNFAPGSTGASQPQIASIQPLLQNQPSFINSHVVQPAYPTHATPPAMPSEHKHPRSLPGTGQPKRLQCSKQDLPEGSDLIKMYLSYLQHFPNQQPLPEQYRLYAQQIQAEQGAFEGARAAALEQMERHLRRRDRASLPELAPLARMWMQQLAAEIEQEQAQFLRLVAGKPVQRPFTDEQAQQLNLPMMTSWQAELKHYGPFLLLFEPLVLADITLAGVFNYVLTHRLNSTVAVSLALKLGNLVQERFIALQAAKKKDNAEKQDLQRLQQLIAQHDARPLDVLTGVAPEEEKQHRDQVAQRAQAYAAAMQRLDDARGMLMRRQYSASKLQRLLESIKDAHAWDATTKIKLGMALLHMILRSTTVWDVESQKAVPAFMHAMEPHNDYVRGIFHLNGAVQHHLMENAKSISSFMLLRHPPMLVEPVPWTHYEQGAYVSSSTDIVKLGITCPWGRQHFIRAHQEGRMQRLYNCLNILGSTPWRVNASILNVMEEVWEQMKDSPNVGLPCRVASAEDVAILQYEPPKFTPYLRLIPAGFGSGGLTVSAGPMTPHERQKLKICKREASRRSGDHLSQRVMFELKLKAAQEHVKHDKIYYPHNIDFRGRAYPMHPYLQHLGDDVCRGLLMFAEARPLGPHGLDWLYVQVANCFGQGKDKLPLEGRKAFAIEHLDQVRASALDPLGGSASQSWWQQGEKPWQLLATCMDVQRALDSGDPTSFRSHLAVHQDGTCNGLQHYAALSRDEQCGIAVNVLPSSTPQDVYSAVARAVEKNVRRDASEGNLRAMQFIQRNERNGVCIDRKLIKQTVMTVVYGVTFIGAMDQIKGQLMSRPGWEMEDEAHDAAAYLAKLTLSSIGDVFVNANAIKDWLTKCASAVAKTNEPVRWNHPLGFPIWQPYYQDNAKRVRSLLQWFHKLLPPNKLDKRAQRSAFPPNYIHCLDSTHMMMTAEACHEHGITFAGVHDSFWTHASTVDTMNSILRDKFIELHSQPLLEQLQADLQAYAPLANLPPIPKRGNLKLELVKQSRYFFS